MAQDPNNPPINNDEMDHTWPTAVILNQAYALSFACIKCKGLPRYPMNDNDGEILCNKCAKDMDGVVSSKVIQKLINKLKTKCLSRTQHPNQKQNDADTEGNNLVLTKANDQCDWNGIIQDYNNHDKECLFKIVMCNECKVFKCKRKLLDKHLNQCPELSINCPLSCGSSIVRKNTQHHLNNDCMEQLIDCANDDCKMQIKRQNFKNHVNNECSTRIVECKFKKYGCNVTDIKANELKQHMNDYKLEHMSDKFDFITNQLIKENTKLKQHQVPKGCIIMWSGAINEIPKGWKLCDGTDNTPDLKGKFVLGGNDNDFKIGDVGGTKSHSHNITVGNTILTVNQMPQHSHAVKFSLCKYSTNTVSGGSTSIDRFGNDVTIITNSSGGRKPHNHSGSCNTTNNMPPYVVLGYIMKIN